MTAGDRIRIERERLGMTQDELAKKLGYSNRSSVTKVETCRDLSLKKIREYAKALGVTPSFLLGWEDRDGNDLCPQLVDEYVKQQDILLEIQNRYSKADDLTQAMVRKLLGIE